MSAQIKHPSKISPQVQQAVGQTVRRLNHQKIEFPKARRCAVTVPSNELAVKNDRILAHDWTMPRVGRRKTALILP